MAAWRDASYFSQAERAAPASLIIAIAQINIFNRVDVATRQIAGQWAP